MTKCSNDACTDFAACPAGWSSGTQPEPLRSCKQCDAGKTSSAASTVCRDCTKGKFGVIDSSGAGDCASCPSGYFQPEETSATSCSRCPAGWAQESEGESSCKDLGGIKPSDCKDDEYFNVTECVDCPDGGSCVGDITASGIRTLFGWYQCPNDALNLTYVPCVFGAACLGAKNDAFKGKFEVKLSNDAVSDPALADNTSSCAAGYSNARSNLRCSTCAPNYAHVEGGRCEKCTGGSEGSLAIIVVALVLAIFLFTIAIALKMKSKGSRKAEHSTLKRTLLTHLQMLSIVVSLTVPWPTAVRNILTFVSSITSISAQASSIQCASSAGEELTFATIYYIALICSVLLPFVMMLVTFLYWFVCVPRCKVLSCGRKVTRSSMCPARNPFRARQQLQEQQEEQQEEKEEQEEEKQEEKQEEQKQELQQQQEAPSSAQSIESDTPSFIVTPTRNSLKGEAKKKKKAIRSTRDGWIITNVLVVYTLSPSIIKSCFQMLQPEEVCQTQYWALDDTIKFDDGTHQMLILSVAVPSLILYSVVCPLLAVFYIGRHTNRQTNKKLMFRFGLLYSGFAPKYWFYELILFLRKLLIILVVTVASLNKQQLHIALGVLIVLLYLLEYLRPYNAEDAGSKDRFVQNRLHRIESLSLVILISMVWSAVFFVLGCKNDDWTCSVLGVFVIVLNVIFALGVGYVFFKSYQKNIHLREKLEKLVSKFRATLSRGSGHGSPTGEEAGVTLGTNPMHATRGGAAAIVAVAATTTPHAARARWNKLKQATRVSRKSRNGGKQQMKLLSKAMKARQNEFGDDGGNSLGEDVKTIVDVETPVSMHVDEETGRRYSYTEAPSHTEWLSDDNDGSEAPQENVVESKKRTKRLFRKFLDEDDDVYYENVETGEVVWDLPDDGKLETKRLFRKFLDDDDNAYYENMETGEVVWDLPDDGELVGKYMS